MQAHRVEAVFSEAHARDIRSKCVAKNAVDMGKSALEYMWDTHGTVLLENALKRTLFRGVHSAPCLLHESACTRHEMLNRGATYYK